MVKKANGTIRLCGDYSTDLKEALNLHQYPLPLPEDHFAKLNSNRIFEKIDLSDAYLQVAADDDVRRLLTIKTHRGLYQYNRLPLGVNAAPGLFQQLMDTMLADIPSACAVG
ncbi:unnamed protein product [Dicrocoelium dendriticum]|nr:unnamed protein product [Dicrocoelium dendriticum]